MFYGDLWSRGLRGQIFVNIIFFKEYSWVFKAFIVKTREEEEEEENQKRKRKKTEKKSSKENYGEKKKSKKKITFFLEELRKPVVARAPKLSQFRDWRNGPWMGYSRLRDDLSSPSSASSASPFPRLFFCGLHYWLISTLKGSVHPLQPQNRRLHWIAAHILPTATCGSSPLPLCSSSIADCLLWVPIIPAARLALCSSTTICSSRSRSSFTCVILERGHGSFVIFLEADILKDRRFTVSTSDLKYLFLAVVNFIFC